MAFLKCHCGAQWEIRAHYIYGAFVVVFVIVSIPMRYSNPCENFNSLFVNEERKNSSSHCVSLCVNFLRVLRVSKLPHALQFGIIVVLAMSPFLQLVSKLV